jgi:mannose-6-phosphate isomerase-like protein (cupin superfamily)
MHTRLTEVLSKLPLPATDRWPEGVWDIQAFSHGTMSAILFTPRGEDHQSAHKQDELYVVLKGSGVLVVEEARHPFESGDLLFVPANKAHRFEEFSQDIIAWALFWGPTDGEQAEGNTR